MTNSFILATDVKRSLSYKAPDRRRQRNPEISPPLTKVSFYQKIYVHPNFIFRIMINIMIPQVQIIMALIHYR